MASIQTPVAGGQGKRNSITKLNLPAIEKKDAGTVIKKKRGGRKVYHDHDANDEMTKNKLTHINFEHDELDEIQHECNCRRHTFKAQVIRPDLTKVSNYRQAFIASKPIPNVVNHSKEYDKLLGPHIGLDSHYSKSYHPNAGDKLERPKPEDLLKAGGPSPFLTSYSSGFPGHRTVNQYVKPTDSQIRGNFPLSTKSTYAKEFGNRSCPKDIKAKIPDSLKLNQMWLGETSYRNKFIQPNPEHYAEKVKNKETLESNPLYKRQYQTTYKNTYLSQEAATCPAKQKLERKMKGTLQYSKDRFAENSDFKSLSPDYHAISTSKHSYV